MAISVTCGCGKTYRVGDVMAGKKGKCHVCGGVLEIPPAEEPIVDLSPLESPSSRAPVRPPALPIGAGSSVAISARPYPAQSARAEPPLGSISPLVRNIAIAVAGLIVVLFAVMLILPSTAEIPLIGLVVIGMALILLGGIRLIIIPFRESTACGLMCMFVPFYGLYYLISRWPGTRASFGIYIAGVVVLVGSVLGSGAPGRAAETRLSVQSAMNLRQCGLALNMYSHDSGGHWPRDLVFLTNEPCRFLTEKTVVTPGTQIQYTYLMPPQVRVRTLNPAWPVAYDTHLADKGRKIPVLFADYGVKIMERAAFQATLDDFRNKALPDLTRHAALMSGTWWRSGAERHLVSFNMPKVTIDQNGAARGPHIVGEYTLNGQWIEITVESVVNEPSVRPGSKLRWSIKRIDAQNLVIGTDAGEERFVHR